MPIEGLLFFGTIMGWASLAELYKQLGVYENACGGSNSSVVTNATGVINCNERDEIFAAIGTYGSISMNCMTFPLGVILDKYGTFAARSLCTSLMTAGLVFFMFAVEVHWMIYPGLMLFTSGSYSLLVTNLPLSQLFPKATASIMIFGQCVFQLSGSAFRFWSFLFESQVSFNAIIIMNLVVTGIHWLRTVFLMPLGWIDPKDEQKIAPFYKSPFSLGTCWPADQIKQRRLKASKGEAEKTAIEFILSAEFLHFMLWVSLGNIDSIFFAFTFNQYARSVTEDYAQLIDFFGSVVWSAAIFSIGSGFVTDSFTAKIKRPALEAKSLVTVGFMLFDNFAGLATHGLQLIGTEQAAKASIIMWNCYRGLLYSSAAVYIRCSYPMYVFGTLIGVFRITMGLTSFANIGLGRVLTTFGSDGYTYLTYAFSAALLLTMTFPITALYRHRNTK